MNLRRILFIVLWSVVAVFCVLMPVTAQDTTSTLPQCPAFPFTWGSRYFVSPDFDRDRTVFVRTSTDEWRLYRSIDSGRTWQVSLDLDIWAMGFSPDFSQDRTVYAGALDGSAGQRLLARSTDGGTTWRSVVIANTNLGPGTPALAVVDANTLYLALYGASGANATRKGLFYSADGGVTWEHLFGGDVNDIALSPRYLEDHTLFIAARSYKSNRGLFKSTDSGHTWVPRSVGLYLDGGASTWSPTFSPGYPADTTMFCQSTGIFYRSANAGGSWEQVYPRTPPTGPPSDSGGYWVLSPYFGHDHTAWLSNEGAIRMSTDTGDSWRELAPLINLAARESCAADGRCGTILLAAKSSGQGFYLSYDRGQTWHCPQEDVIPPWAALPPAEVPEPATWLLLAVGTAAFAAHGSRRRERVPT